ncbi:MAG TPA: DUF2752 domain-containing protein [Phycisphaerales bacterium]|nr:DUF2752 domain-containing protein [Phycisphaerales bacterium]
MAATSQASAPLATRPVLRASIGTRLLAAFLGLIALSVLILAARLVPDPRGMGTHQQLDLPPCGWLLATGYPCPTCGMTTAFSNAAHARARASFEAQPFGALFAIATAIFFWGAMHVAVFASNLGRVFERLLAPRYLWPGLILFLAAWGYKAWQVHSMR